MEPWLDDASSLADAIRGREIRSVDAVEASLEAIANSKLNALTFLDAEGARRQAEQIDARIARGKDAGLLSGVPILVKDVEDAAGWPTTHGSLVFKENIAAEDSTHVARLRAAGAVLVGKAATSEFGFVAYTSTKLQALPATPGTSSALQPALPEAPRRRWLVASYRPPPPATGAAAYASPRPIADL